jgi:hypothetical protein
MDILPTTLALATYYTARQSKTLTGDGSGSNGNKLSDSSDSVIIDGRDASDILLDRGAALSLHDFLPFYNGPSIANVSSQMYAAVAMFRTKPPHATDELVHGLVKCHFVTSAGLGSYARDSAGRKELANITVHDPPLCFAVHEDPSEAYPISLPKAYRDELMRRKASFEASFYARSINMNYR